MSAAFTQSERRVLLAVKGVGPTVVLRLEQMGIATLADLATRDAAVICAEAAGLTGGTCWKNSPQARKAIDAAIMAARTGVSSDALSQPGAPNGATKRVPAKRVPTKRGSGAV